MKAEKKKLSDLTLCYCVSALNYQGRRHFLVASEKEYACLLFDEQGRQVDKIWDGPGGTMSAVQIPGSDGTFLATHRFYSPNNCKEAEIVLCWPQDGAWQVRAMAQLPGVHRFDILTSGGGSYLIACTIKSDYTCKDDWSFPGKVWGCRLPEDMSALPEDYRLPLTVLKEGLVKNHGYSRHRDCGIVTSEEGVFRFTPPREADGDWGIEQLLDEPTSDVLLLDLDGDGEDEMLTLSPFHGDTLKVFKKAQDHFVPVFVYGKKIEFAHAICSAEWGGRNFAVIGHRKGDRDLLAVSCRDGSYTVEVIDHDVGPANALSAQIDGKTVILSANREINEIAYYTVTEV